MSIMGLTTQKVLIKVDGDSKDAVRALNETKKAADVSAASLGKLGAAASKALGDMKQDLAGMAKSQAMNAIAGGLGEMASKLRDLTNIPIGGSGTMIGYTLGGPMGAAVGTLVETMNTGFGEMRDMVEYAATGVDEFRDAIVKLTAPTIALYAALSPLAGGFAEMRGVTGLAAKQLAEYNLVLDLSGATGTRKFHEQIDSINRVMKDHPDIAHLAGDAIRKLSESHTSGSVAVSAHTSALRAFTEERRRISNDYARGTTDDLLAREGEGSVAGSMGGMAGIGMGLAAQNPDSFTIPSGEVGIDWAAMRENIDLVGVHAREALDSLKGPTLGEKLFGSVTEIDMYKESWGVLTSAVGSGYEAMVDGSMSFGKAAKQSAADAIKAIGKKMGIRALEEGAEAVGSLARYDYPGFANHTASAALFLAGAAATGYAANQMGTTAGNAASAARAADAQREKEKAEKEAEKNDGKSLGSGGSGQQIIIVYSDSFAQDSARSRQLTAERTVAMALGAHGLRNS